MPHQLFHAWKQSVPDLQETMRRMQDRAIIAVGVNPYPRIIPSLFLKNFAIYSVKNAADVDTLRRYATIFCLEERFPKAAQKIRATNYLLGNYAFQAFLKSRRTPFSLLLYQTTPPIIKKLEEQGISWIGNRPESFDEVILKSNFRTLIHALRLPELPVRQLSRQEFLAKTFPELFSYWQRPVVVQRGDFDVSGEQGTFFIRDGNDWRTAQEILSQDERYTQIQISPLIRGPSLSMLGCITHLGVLTSTLQLQFIDVPEALAGQLPTGVFLGHDWGLCPWDEKAEKTAQHIVESVGSHLSKQGYRGIFGIDFIYDQESNNLFPLECNPRFTGALPVYSLMTMQAGQVPPLDFFHLAEHLNIKPNFNFPAVNEKLKERQAVSHISLTPKGIYEMRIPLAAGVYSYLPGENALRYERPGALLSDMRTNHEFLLIDSVPRLGSSVTQNVPRLFKLIFRHSIATSSYSVKPEFGQLIAGIARLMRKNQVVPKHKTQQQPETIEE